MNESNTGGDLHSELSCFRCCNRNRARAQEQRSGQIPYANRRVRDSYLHLPTYILSSTMNAFLTETEKAVVGVAPQLR